MRVETYLLSYQIQNTVFHVNYYSPKKMARRKHKQYTLRIKHALANLHHLCCEVLEYTLNMRYDIKIFFLVVPWHNDSGGFYDIETSSIFVHPDSIKKIQLFELVCFHELIHFIFVPLLECGNNGPIKHLVEGIAYYFQNIYYPNDKMHIDLLNDRLSKSRFAPGYYFTERIINEHLPEFKNYLKNVSKSPEAVQGLENLIKTMVNDESGFVERLLMQFTDFILTNNNETHNQKTYACIFRYKQMKAPMLLKIDQSLFEKLHNAGHYIINDDLNQKIPDNFNSGIIPEGLFHSILIYYAELVTAKPEMMEAMGKKIYYSYKKMV
jgi:hypothetical protein